MPCLAFTFVTPTGSIPGVFAFSLKSPMGDFPTPLMREKKKTIPGLQRKRKKEETQKERKEEILQLPVDLESEISSSILVDEDSKLTQTTELDMLATIRCSRKITL